jgi:hypothetical protein
MSRASDRREGRSWPGYLFGGRVRTSTVVLLIAFFATWWIFETYQPAPAPPEQVPASDVVPPGFIPDPAYTWAPRTDVQQRPPAPTTTLPTTPTTTPPTTPTSVGEVPAAPTPGAATEPTTTPEGPVPGGGVLPPPLPSEVPGPAVPTSPPPPVPASPPTVPTATAPTPATPATPATP